MRVVGGKYRGKKLVSPMDENTRPTLDKTRESIFNIIGMKIMDSTCLDLFAGSGAFGVEALSRGASVVHFNDIHKNAIKVINENIQSLKGLDREYAVFSKGYMEFLRDSNTKYDIVFLDPPYSMKVIGEIVSYMLDNKLVNEGGIFVIETLKEDVFDIDYKFVKVKEYVYGKTKVTVMWK